MPWTSWIVLVEKIGAAETVHVDALVELDHEYEYKVTAFDSMGSESGFSNMTHAHVR
jgi:fibronectin type 3 domain-containing protein